MIRRLRLAWCLTLGITPAAYGQFSLYVLNGNLEQPAPPVYTLGAIYPGESVSARFRLRNTSNSPAALYVLAADGTGFTLAGVPPLPTGLDAQAALDFTVAFQAVNTGAYSAALHSEGVSVLLTATVLPRLTFSVETPAGFQPLGAGPVSFGSLERGTSAVRRFAIENLTPLILTVPAITIQGSGFSLLGNSPSGTALQPRQSARFEVQFLPGNAGSFDGILILGDRSYPMLGAGFDPALPKPSLAVALAQPQSAQQGSVAVKLDAASRTTGAGTLTLEFRPLAPGSTDPGIAFASGSRTIPFSVSPGDTQPLTAPFQTGTTAGDLVFTVSLGGVTDRQSLTIPPAPVGISSAQGARGPGSVEIQVTGFDNTRAAGAIAYTFFDASGVVVPPGVIRVDSSAEFAKFFLTSDAGGSFLLRSVFPATGDVSRIVAFEVEFTNPAGTVKTGRIGM